MSRKDYVMVAAEFAWVLKRHESKEAVAALSELANELANGFKRDNSRFDRQRFLTACGLSE